MIEIKDIQTDFQQHLDSFFVALTLGETGSTSSSLFYMNFFKAIPDDFDEQSLPNFAIYFRQKGLFVLEKMDKKVITDFLAYFIASFSDLQWDVALERLLTYFDWEYGNYQA